MTDQDDVARNLVQRAHAAEVRPDFDVEAGVSDVLARAEVLQHTAPGPVTSQAVASDARGNPLVRRPEMPVGEQLHRRLAADLSTAMICALLRLRVEVFVVEQGRPYQELDGHDLDRTTRHYWLAPYGAIEDAQATLRLLEPTEGQFRIGRVCAARQARATGGVQRLLEAALTEVGDAPCVLDAQIHSIELYAAFGFMVDGAEFTEGGVVHVPMGRKGSTAEALLRSQTRGREG